MVHGLIQPKMDCKLAHFELFYLICCISVSCWTWDLRFCIIKVALWLEWYLTFFPTPVPTNYFLNLARGITDRQLWRNYILLPKYDCFIHCQRKKIKLKFSVMLFCLLYSKHYVFIYAEWNSPTSVIYLQECRCTTEKILRKGPALHKTGLKR